MVIATPSDEDECRKLLTSAFLHPGPSAVRYPRGTGPGATIEAGLEALPIGKGLIKRQGQRVAFLAFGTVLAECLKAAEALNATVADMRFVKPLDRELILSLANTHELLVTVEENAIMGGAGAAVSEVISNSGGAARLLPCGLPDRFLDQNTQENQRLESHLDADSLIRRVHEAGF
jgi:1-deoxy-D-xylulose-5-phosphate synthase